MLPPFPQPPPAQVPAELAPTFPTTGSGRCWSPRPSQGLAALAHSRVAWRRLPAGAQTLDCVAGRDQRSRTTSQMPLSQPQHSVGAIVHHCAHTSRNRFGSPAMETTRQCSTLSPSDGVGLGRRLWVAHPAPGGHAHRHRQSHATSAASSWKAFASARMIDGRPGALDQK